MFGLTLVTGPASEPVSVATLKTHLRINVNDEDTLLASYITAARMTFENLSGLALIAQTWKLSLDGWPLEDVIYLPRPPLQSVSHVKYRDREEVLNTLASSKYYVDAATVPGRIVFGETFDRPTLTDYQLPKVEIQFVAGFVSVPEQVKLAIMLLAGTFYKNREHLTDKPLTELPLGFKAIVNQHKVGRHVWEV
jgi:uncharacterized phiE125 gp8 family phage protein